MSTTLPLTQTSIKLPDVSYDEQAIIDGLLNKLSQKWSRNQIRAEYYDGRRAVHQLGSIIPPQYTHLALVLGWSAKAVDILARRCNWERLIWSDGDLDSLGYQEMVDGNHLKTRMSSGIISSLLHGTAFLINTEGDPEVGEPQALIHVKDAFNATGTWNSRAYRLDNLLSITRRDDAGMITGFALYMDGQTIVGEKFGDSWMSARSQHGYGVPAEALVYKPREGRPFGSSRISRPVMAIHDAALRTLIRLEGHADVYSWPEMWMLGADEKIFKNADGTQKAVWQTMLGRIKGIPDDPDADPALARADVKQFPASSPEPHLALLNAQAKLFARETSLPDTSIAITDFANPTSADSYDASQHELISEAEGAVDDWSLPIQRAGIRALAMQNNLNKIPKEWSSIMPKFRSPRFLSRAAEADAGQKTIAAIPWLAETEVGLEILGLDPQQIKRALAERDIRATTSDGALLAAALDRQTAVPASPFGAPGGTNS